MKTLHSNEIIRAVEKLCYQCNILLPQDIFQSLKKAQGNEKHPRAKKILNFLLENAAISEKEHIALCQDCGIGIFWVEWGHELHIEGNINLALQEGMSNAYQQGYLRKSIVQHPFHRINTQNNCPPIIHIEIQEGSHLRIHFSPKGAGSENCTKLAFFNPGTPVSVIEEWVYHETLAAAKKACGPLIVGIGIGGSSEYCAWLAKKALFRTIGNRSSDLVMKKMEINLFERINQSGVGPQGLGGETTTLEVFIEWFPTHIAMLPVALNFQCHAARHGKVEWI